VHTQPGAMRVSDVHAQSPSIGYGWQDAPLDDSNPRASWSRSGTTSDSATGRPGPTDL